MQLEATNCSRELLKNATDSVKCSGVTNSDQQHLHVTPRHHTAALELGLALT